MLTEQKHDDNATDGNLYAVACALSKSDGHQYTTSMSLHTLIAASEEEAKGSAVIEALKMKPGFGVHQVLCLKIEVD